MSRGHGRVERAVLASLRRWAVIVERIGAEGEYATVASLTNLVFDIDVPAERPTRAQRESVRRACRTLAAEGAAELTYVDGALGARVPPWCPERRVTTC